MNNKYQNWVIFNKDGTKTPLTCTEEYIQQRLLTDRSIIKVQKFRSTSKMNEFLHI